MLAAGTRPQGRQCARAAGATCYINCGSRLRRGSPRATMGKVKAFACCDRAAHRTSAYTRTPLDQRGPRNFSVRSPYRKRAASPRVDTATTAVLVGGRGDTQPACGDSEGRGAWTEVSGGSDATWIFEARAQGVVVAARNARRGLWEVHWKRMSQADERDQAWG